MKKTYINPEIGYDLLDTQDLLGVSQNPEGFNGTPDNDNTISPDDMLSRRRSVWEDGEDF